MHLAGAVSALTWRGELTAKVTSRAPHHHLQVAQVLFVTLKGTFAIVFSLFFLGKWRLV